MRNKIGYAIGKQAIEGLQKAKRPARGLVVGGLAMILLTSHASAKDVWSGSGLSDLFSSKSKISDACTKVTGQADDVKGFVTALDGTRSKMGDFLTSLVQSTKAVEAADKTKDLQKIKDATKAEAMKVKIWVSCDASKPKKLVMDVWAKNGDGTKIKLNPPGY